MSKNRKKIQILIIVLASFISNIIYCQNTILLFSNYPSNISIVEKNHKVVKNPIWENNSGGYILDIKNSEETKISASKNLSFKLSTNNVTTKNIVINKGEELNLHRCLNSQEYCCENLSSKQQSATKKIYSVSLMKKSANKNKVLIFKNPSNEFFQIEDLFFTWETDSIVSKLSIIEIESLETIFEKEINDTLSSISFSTIKDDLKNKLKLDANYMLKVFTRNLDDNKLGLSENAFPFELKSMAFTNKEYYFPSFESVCINWKSNFKTDSIVISNKKGDVIFVSNDIEENNFCLSNVIEKDKIEPAVDYIVSIWLENNTVERYPFVILLDKEETDALKELLFFE